MKPIEFEEQTAILKAPEGMEDCVDLPVHTGGGVIVSKWECSDIDIEQIKKNGYIWVYVFSGETQPPIAFSTEDTIFIPNQING